MKKRITILLLVVVAAACFGFNNGTPTAYAAESGALIKDCVIVVSADAKEYEVYAANVMRDYLYQASGAQPDIISDDAVKTSPEIVIGDTNRRIFDFSGRSDGAYDIYSDGESVYISGVIKGNIYGVYAYLKEYAGCSFFTSEIISVKYKPDLTIPKNLNVKYDPYFEYRETDWLSPYDAEYSLANGLNGGTYRQLSGEQGGMVEYISGFAHTLTNQFCGSDKYFNSNPEYFALINGKRDDDQLCLTNEKVYEIVLSEILELLAEKWQSDAPLQIVSLTQHDNENFCRCDACASLDNENNSHAGSLITFVNRIARELVTMGYHNIAVDTFAYQYTRKAPSSVIPEPNVIVRLCSIECCFAHALDDSDCPLNEEFMRDLTAWGEICDRLYIWDYTTNYSQTIGVFPNFGVLQRNIQIFYENNVKGVYEEGNYFMDRCNTEFGELRSYLLANLLMNPYLDYYAAMDDFLVGYYGGGGQYIREFIDLITDKAVKAGKHLTISTQMKDTLDFSKSDIEYADGLFNKAKNAVSGIYLENVKRSELSYRYWKACNRAGEFANIFKYPSLSRRLYEDILASGLIMYSEGGRIENIASYYEYVTPAGWISDKSAVRQGFIFFAAATSVILLFIGFILAISLVVDSIIKKNKNWLFALWTLLAYGALIIYINFVSIWGISGFPTDKLALFIIAMCYLLITAGMYFSYIFKKRGIKSFLIAVSAIAAVFGGVAAYIVLALENNIAHDLASAGLLFVSICAVFLNGANIIKTVRKSG